MCDNGVHGDDKAEQEEQETTKRCSKCGKEKPVTEFHKSKKNKDGLKCACKVCRNAAKAKYRAENPEKIKEYHAKWYTENRDKKLAYCAKYKKDNPDKVRAHRHQRRAVKANATGTHTADDWKERLAYHGYKCIYCGVEKHETPQEWLTCEHLIPLSRGGSNWPSNLAPSCTSCNSSKGTKTHLEYLEFLNGK